MKNCRNSRIELLRILAMIFIVFSHYTMHGNFDYTGFGVNKYILHIFTLGNLGVDIFVIIMGYYLVNKEVSAKKILRLLLQVSFYSISIYLLLCLGGFTQFNAVDFLKAILPAIFVEYWFFSVYLALYMLSPYINILLRNLTYKQMLHGILLMLFIWSVFPTFTTIDFSDGGRFAQFVLLYCIGAFLRLFPKNVEIVSGGGYKGTIFLGAVLLISVLCLDILGTRFDVCAAYSTYFLSRNSIFLVGLAVSICLIFFSKKAFYSKIVNEISASTFGVYLIHDNQYMRTVIWEKLLKNNMFQNSEWLLLHMLLSVLIVFSACCFIDYIRRNTIEKVLFQFIDKNWVTWKIKRF